MTKSMLLIAGCPRRRWPPSIANAGSALEQDFAMLAPSYTDAQSDPAPWRPAFSDVECDLAWVDAIDSPTRATLDTFCTDVELFHDAATTTADNSVAPAVRSG